MMLACSCFMDKRKTVWLSYLGFQDSILNFGLSILDSALLFCLLHTLPLRLLWCSFRNLCMDVNPNFVS
jgi:hypothetical protein